MARTVLIAHEHFAVQHLVVPEYVVDHLLIEALWRALERDLHSARLLRLQVDVPAPCKPFEVWPTVGTGFLTGAPG